MDFDWKDTSETDQERKILAKVSKTTDHGYSEQDYEDYENGDVKKEGIEVYLYKSQGDMLEGKLKEWTDLGLTANSQGVPYITSTDVCFTVNLKNGDIRVTQGAPLGIHVNIDMLYEALSEYDSKFVEALSGKLKIVLDEGEFLFQ